MEHNFERSESGYPIYQHSLRDREFEFAIGDEGTIESVSAHIEKHVGHVEMVFHEMISDMVHVDVYWIAPTPKRNYHTLITSGMSDREMPAPDRSLRFAELMICLPPTWPVSIQAFQDDQNYWPVRWLKFLARFPHEYETWLFASHTIPNGDPPQPFAQNTKFCCAMLFLPLLFGDAFHKLVVSPDKTIRFLSLIPLYREEMDFKLRKGFEPLLDRLEAEKVTEYLTIDRKNVCKKRWWLF